MESSTRPKSDRRKSVRSKYTVPMTASMVRRISEAEIARRAFELYCSRGGQHGQDVNDWLSAERELLAAPPAASTAADAPQAVEIAIATKPARRKRTPPKPASLD